MSSNELKNSTFKKFAEFDFATSLQNLFFLSYFENKVIFSNNNDYAKMCETILNVASSSMF